MKAISVRQPWADLILKGKKTIDLRTNKVQYRGPLVIHASQIIEKEACERFDIDSDKLTTGAVIGVVELVDVMEMGEEGYQQMREGHLNHRKYKEGLFGWRFANPKILPVPFSYKGKHGLFNVPEDFLLTKKLKTDKQPSLYKITPPWSPQKPFD